MHHTQSTNKGIYINMAFLPIEPTGDGQQLDFVLISPEAYVDHSSFGHAIIARLVEAEGFSIAINVQPKTDKDYTKFGRPRIGFLISGGVVDSMVNNYTVAKHKRKVDVYSHGGVAGNRPDRAVDVYSNALKRLYPDCAVIIGGIEASLRRFAHYDYWADKVLPSILVSSKADLLIYGMGERPFWDILALVRKGVPLADIKDVRGTAYLSSYDNLSAAVKEDIHNNVIKFCPSYQEVLRDKIAYVKSFNMQSQNADPASAVALIQKHGSSYLVQNKPQLPLTEKEMDYTYALPFEGEYHPSYTKGVPAITEVKFSITSHRGCFGSCSYCALTFHQGRRISKRSKQSIVAHARQLTKKSDFKGYINDIGGPTANFRNNACEKQEKYGACKDKLCIGYEPCANLKVDHSEYIDILRAVRDIEGIKKVFIRSGIRYDYLMMEKDPSVFDEIVQHHISGQLKVAPEHSSEKVLKLMNKPTFKLYKQFADRYKKVNAKLNKKQFVVPYLISSHPGCTIKDAVELTEYLKSIGYMPEQVQDFYPTPSTRSTCMYYTGIDPTTMQEIFVPKTAEEKRMQRALLQYRLKENLPTVSLAYKLAKVPVAQHHAHSNTNGKKVSSAKPSANNSTRRSTGRATGNKSFNNKTSFGKNNKK